MLDSAAALLVRSGTLVSVTLASGLLLIFYHFYNIFFHPLRKYPGPISWRASRFPYVRSMVSGRLHARLAELHNEYGPVVRIAPNELSYTSAAAWSNIYTGYVGNKGMPKNLIVSGAQPFHSMITTNDPDHSRLRRLLQGAFSPAALRKQEAVFQKYIDRFVDKLEHKIAEGAGSIEIDIVRWINFLTFDLSGTLIFSEEFGCLDNEEYTPWIAMIFGHLRASALGIALRFFPPLDSIAMWAVRRFLGKYARLEEDFIRLADDKVERRLARSGGAAGDLPSSRVSSADSTNVSGKGQIESEGASTNDNGAAFTDFTAALQGTLQTADGRTIPGATRSELMGTAKFLIIAGSETSATVLGGTLNYLCRNQEAMTKLRSEIRKRFSNAKEIGFTEVSTLPYLEAVIKEGLRLCTPLPSGLTRTVPGKGALVDGKWVAGGTFVGVSQHAAYRSPRNFYDGDSFIPERWLDSSATNTHFASDNRDVVHPFFVGARNCLGQAIAWAEMRLLLARLMLAFDFEIIPNKSVRWDDQLTFYLWQKQPFTVKLTKPKK